MKTRGHILGSLLLVGTMTIFQVTYAQEEGFNMPTSERDTESSAINRTTSGEYNSRAVYATEPGKKSNDKKKAENKETDGVKEEQKTVEAKPQTKQPQSKKTEKEPSANPDNSPKNQEESDDSVLSFNFLYYMIQKFKFSDVIDQ